MSHAMAGVEFTKSLASIAAILSPATRATRVMQAQTILVCALLVSTGLAGPTYAFNIFEKYRLEEQFELPAGAAAFHVTPDGRIVTMVGDEVHIETGVQTRAFTMLGTLPSADIASFGAAFVRISPDGIKVAVGNNGGASFSNYEIGVFDFPSLTGDWYQLNHYQAEWYDATHLAITAGEFGLPSVVTVLDTTSPPAAPTNPIVIDNIGGASAGITFDSLGNLYTGNAFTGDGPSSTGWIKVFEHAAWSPALSGASPLDFESAGTLLVDLLSADSLGFDAAGNLHVGGGDFFGGADDVDFFGVVRNQAVQDVLAGGLPIDPLDSAAVRRFDPDTDSDFNFYSVTANPITSELYAKDFGSTVYVYRFTNARVPAVSGAGALGASAVLMLAAAWSINRRRYAPCPRNTNAPPAEPRIPW